MIGQKQKNKIEKGRNNERAGMNRQFGDFDF